ncbi:MAG: hypothetical protein DRQ56_05825 [Gammaproteobacteria bacterium]|nr:MAG: hypothetical protein DRQ56_05825 [Gammaproteobacteria bacterium]
MIHEHNPETCSIGHRVARVEEEISSIRDILRELAATQSTLARIEERSCNQQIALDGIYEQTRGLVVRIDTLEKVGDNINGGKRVLITLGGLLMACVTLYAVWFHK